MKVVLRIGSPREALDLIMDAIDKAGYKGKIGIALDVAALNSTKTVSTI